MRGEENCANLGKNIGPKHQGGGRPENVDGGGGAHISVRAGPHVGVASFTHFLTNEVSAAPWRFLSFACAMQASLSHFFMKLVLAAPASFLSVAWVMQASSAKARVGAPAKQRASASASVFVIDFLPGNQAVPGGRTIAAGALSGERGRRRDGRAGGLVATDRLLPRSSCMAMAGGPEAGRLQWRALILVRNAAMRSDRPPGQR